MRWRCTDMNDEIGKFLREGEHPASLRRMLRLDISVVLATISKADKRAILQNAPLVGEKARDALTERLARMVERYELRWPGDDIADPSLPEPALRIPPPR